MRLRYGLTYRRDVRGGELLIHVAQNDTGFAYTHITDHQELERVIKLTSHNIIRAGGLQ